MLWVSSSRIPAELLPGGRNSHFHFKISLNIHDDSICSITSPLELAELIHSTRLIVWEKIPMQHKYYVGAVGKVLNDICKMSIGKKFANILVALGGDFAQILPIVRHSNHGAIVNASIQNPHMCSNLE